MLALALLVHLLAGSPGAPSAAPEQNAPAREPPASAPLTAAAATAEGTGLGADPLAARPSLALPPAPRASLAPRLRGPFGGKELVMAGLGALAGDALVLGVGYGTLQLFANDVIDPSAQNFRRAAFALAGAALVVPPLLAVLSARLVAGPDARSLWKGLLLATAGHALALATAYWAGPNVWAFLPAQLAAVSAGTSVGLRWGARGRGAPPAAARGDLRAEPPAPALAALHACPVAG